MSTVAEMVKIREIEADAAAPHGLGCFEEYAEKAVETGDSTEGAYDEVLSDGRTLMNHFHTDLAADPKRCTCRTYEDEE